MQHGDIALVVCAGGDDAGGDGIRERLPAGRLVDMDGADVSVSGLLAFLLPVICAGETQGALAEVSGSEDISTLGSMAVWLAVAAMVAAHAFVRWILRSRAVRGPWQGYDAWQGLSDFGRVAKGGTRE